MARGDVEVQQNEDGDWVVVLQGVYPSQRQAESAAHEVARLLNRETFVRGLLGRWLRRDTSGGNDPRNIPN